MDFEEIDRVVADDLNKGDIVFDSGDYLQITGKVDDDGIILTYPAYNLSTGDDDTHFLAAWDDLVTIYRSY